MFCVKQWRIFSGTLKNRRKLSVYFKQQENRRQYGLGTRDEKLSLWNQTICTVDLPWPWQLLRAQLGPLIQNLWYSLCMEQGTGGLHGISELWGRSPCECVLSCVPLTSHTVNLLLVKVWVWTLNFLIMSARRNHSPAVRSGDSGDGISWSDLNF